MHACMYVRVCVYACVKAYVCMCAHTNIYLEYFNVCIHVWFGMVWNGPVVYGMALVEMK